MSDSPKDFNDAILEHIRVEVDAYEQGSCGSVTLIEELQTCSSELAKDEHYRHTIGARNPGLWHLLRDLWQLATSEIYTADEGDTADKQRGLSLNVARLTRNIVAVVPNNQDRAFENESSIRSLVYRYTSYLAVQDPATYPTTRMLVQTLSNLVTGNEALMEKLWKTYLTLPEEQLILLRLLTSPDAKTVSSTLVLALNCIHSSKERMEMLITAPRGPRVTIMMLDQVGALVDSEKSEESQAFNIGFELFTHLIVAGLFPALYKAISVSGEPITPPQTTLLKILDSYLHRSSQGLQAKARNDALVHMLIDTFFGLAGYAQDAIRRALGSASEPQEASESSGLVENSEGHRPTAIGNDSTPVPPKEVDLLLPRVSEALVLVAQCLTTLGLASTEHSSTAGSSKNVKTTLATARSAGGEGLVESLIETLRLLDAFLPRITFGKVVERSFPPAVHPPPANAAARSQSGAEGFSYVKRDLVRLLGIIALDDKDVQDRVRACGGIPVVMNLCVIDDRNPYMKEHAILALRNLLNGNNANQDVVKDIQPVARWDERGVLQSLS